MVGSINAPEPGFRPGVRWELGSPEHGRQRTHQVFVPARAGALARWGSGVRWGFWHARAGSGGLGGGGPALGAGCALAGTGACWGSGARRGVGVPWRLTRSRLRLGWCCGLRVAPGFLFAGLLAVANAMFYFALTWLEYTGCEHMRA